MRQSSSTLQLLAKLQLSIAGILAFQCADMWLCGCTRDSITVEGNQYGDNNHSLGSMPGVAGVAAAGCQGTSVFPHTQSQQPTTYNFTTDEW